MSEIVREPTRFSSRLSLLSAGFAVVLSLSGGTVAAGLSALGLVALAGSLRFGRRRGSDLGGLLLLAGQLAAGLAAVPDPVVLLGTVATVLSWDAATNAHELGAQLGREATTTRAEAMHAAGSVAVGVLVAGAALVVRQFAVGGQPTGALVLMLVAAGVLVLILRE